MAHTNLRFIKRYAEFQDQSQILYVPAKTRGIYMLLAETREKAGQKGKRSAKSKFHVIYVGMARGEKTGIRGRLTQHMNSKAKRGAWTHFTIYEVHDNISAAEIEELEGLFRHVYRQDTVTNSLNKQRKFGRLLRARQNRLKTWNAVAG